MWGKGEPQTLRMFRVLFASRFCLDQAVQHKTSLLLLQGTSLESVFLLNPYTVSSGVRTPYYL